MFLGADDDAVTLLVDHFRGVIQRLKDESWRHSSIGLSTRNRKKKKLYYWSKAESEVNLTLAPDPPSLFTTGPHLRIAFDKVLEKFAKSLRNYDYDSITPMLTNSFGANFVGVADSGIELLFPVRGPGRPRKRPIDLDSKLSPLGQPPSRPVTLESSTYRNRPIAQIHLIARDIADADLYVFVEW